MKIGILIWSLCKSRGGMERCGAMLANEMHHRGHKVIVFCHDYEGTVWKPVYNIESEIEIEYWGNINQYRFYDEKKSSLSKHQLDVFCAMFSWEMLLICPTILKGTGIPFIISEHNNPQVINEERWNHYERIGCLAAADSIHLLLEEYKYALPSFLQKKAVSIPNPAPKIVPPFVIPPKERLRLLAMGRFVDRHKQFSLLIKAFAQLSQAFPLWDLHIAGEGNDLNKYQSLIKELGLDSRVFLPGPIENTDDFYISGDLFCIPSRYEGFPLVAVEAQSYGLPLVGLKSCSGVNEIIVHGENGFLADDGTPENLVTWLAIIMQDSILRQDMSRRSLILNKRYDNKNIYDRWESLFRETSTCIKNTNIDRL
jgi:glycosyltransferase involved in cell wall biosynthesis